MGVARPSLKRRTGYSQQKNMQLQSDYVMHILASQLNIAYQLKSSITVEIRYAIINLDFIVAQVQKSGENRNWTNVAWWALWLEARQH